MIASAQADGMVIANSSSGQAALSKGEISKIFLGKQTSWANGSSISVGYHSSDNDVSQTFFKKFVGKKYKKFKKIWLKKVFSGNGVAPQTFDSSAKAVAYVSSTAGAIAFIDASSPPSGVTVIEIGGVSSFK